MLFVANEVRLSPIEGKGLFALEPIRRKTIIGDLTYETNIISESEYQSAQKAGNTAIIQCGVRLVGNYFVCPAEAEAAEGIFKNEDYINHSEDPSMLYHCGILFAKKDIQAGEELTVNYKYFLAVNDVESFTDKYSGRRVSGLTGDQALLMSAGELSLLLNLP
jgi:hypothetical protein